MSQYQRNSRGGSNTRLIIEPEIAQHKNSNSRFKDSAVPHRYNTRSSGRFFAEDNQDQTIRLDDSANSTILSGADDSDMSLRTGVSVNPTHLNPCSEPNFSSYGRYTKYGLIFLLIGAIGILGQSFIQKYHKTIDLESDLIDVKTLMNEMKNNMESILKARDETSKVIDDIHQLFHRLESRETEIGRKSYDPMLERMVEENVDGGNVESAIQTALEKYDADKIAMPDFALESAGAEIVATPNTINYNSDDSITLLGWRLCSNSRGPSVILQPSVMPGQCWAFCGSCGSVVIKLMAEITVSAVTLEHIPKQISPSNDVSSAPKDFAVYGVDEELQQTKLGKFVYECNGYPIQTFNVPKEGNRNSFSMIRFDFLSNHGNPHYTCVYRVRVHGDIKGSKTRATAN